MNTLHLDTKDDSYFLSGFLALLFYITCILLLLLYLDKSKIKKISAFKKNTVLELEIIIDPKIKVRRTQKSKAVKKVEETYVKKSKSVSTIKTASVKTLFSNVKTKAKKIKKEVVNNLKTSSVASRNKSKFEKERKTSSLKVSNILDDITVKSKQSVSMDTKYEKDPYYSKINELLTQRWNNVRTFDELSAKVIITITSNGELSYRILSRSGNDIFDASLKEFLEEQRLITYPSYTKGSRTDIKLIFGTSNN
ncbi:MAG: TonB C-terminal domain-containing protein [Campylobacteraceae bacterium]|nr:TonB C-terminal domain-containing protein [Campylobacteraceae bacterium]